MAFIKIVKEGNRPMKIPESSLPKYEACGWKQAGKKVKQVVKQDIEEDSDENESDESEENNSDEDESEENVSNKSVDEMSMEELQNKAKELEVNTKNLTTIGALRKAVKRAMANE